MTLRTILEFALEHGIDLDDTVEYMLGVGGHDGYGAVEKVTRPINDVDIDNGGPCGQGRLLLS